MKFNDYRSGYSSVFHTDLALKMGLSKQTPDVFYTMFAKMMARGALMGSSICRMPDGSVNMAPLRQCLIEQQWYRLQRPYYSVWPGIIEPLTKVDLTTVTCDQIRLPLPCIVFRLNDGNTMFTLDNGTPLKSILVSDAEHGIMNPESREFTLWMDFGENVDGQAVWTYRRFLMRPGWTIGQALLAMGSYEHVPHSTGVSPLCEAMSSRIVSLVIGCLLLDTDFVVPDVLNKDKDKPITDERIARAHNKGKVGWDIGREIDVNPHWRRPHPALMWTGKGRTVPRITMRKGSIVKRSTISTVPTGFLGKETAHDESN